MRVVYGHQPLTSDPHTHARTSALPVPVQLSKCSISGEKGWGAVWTSGYGTWHVRQGPAATLQAGKDFPRNILPAPINTISSVCPPAPKSQKKSPNPKQEVLSRGVTVAWSSHKATTALSHEVTDASPEGVGVVWPNSG